jgi:two-component system sensor histidine kinase HydH
VTAKLLIAEDNQDFVANLTEILEGFGHEVRSAASCAAALELGRNWVQVALVDLRLPDGQGTLLAEQLKADNPDCEVVLLTGFASVESAAAAVRAGVWDYLVKPCATPDLLATLSKALRHVHSQIEKRELSRRAQRAEKLAAVGTLTAGLSHEIRNPLNAAALQLTVLERRVRKLDPPLQPALLEPVTLVRDEIRRLDHILKDFLQFARPRPVTMRKVVVEEVMKKVVALLRSDADRRHISLQCVSQSALEVSGDADQLQQVLMNLTLNALDASGKGGRVELSSARRAQGIHMYVDDSGPGLEQAVKDRLFEPFFTTKEQGSGLGLPISNAIVSQHGGHIKVAHSPLGGARFEVILEAHAPPPLPIS